MPSLTSRAALWCARNPGPVLVLWGILFTNALAAVALLLSGALTTNVLYEGDGESKAGTRVVTERLGEQNGVESVLVRSDEFVVDDEPFRAFVADLADQLNEVADVSPEPALISPDRHAAVLQVSLPADEKPEQAIEPVLQVLDAAPPAFAVTVTGPATIGHDLLTMSERDLQKGEALGMPAALLILLVVFGSAVAGLVPLLLTLVTIPVTLGIAALLGQISELSFFLVNMVTAMGLALGIDYTLFVLSRYREERAAGRAKVEAIGWSAGTAGRAVLFSGLAFAVSLSGMFLIPDTVLRSLALGAVLVGVVTVASALTLLPAVLAILGDRVNALRISGVRRSPGTQGVWVRVVQAVLRRPGIALAVSATVLVVAAAPVLALATGSSGVEELPDGARSKQGVIALAANVGDVGGGDPAEIVVDADPTQPAVAAALTELRDRIAASDEFGEPDLVAFPEQDLAVLYVPLPGAAASDVAEQAVRTLRAEFVAPAMNGIPTYVTGTSARALDYADLVSRWLPVVIAFVLAVTFVLLTAVFRSVVLSLKAVLLNLLSVGAAYGLLVLVFQHGVGADALGLTRVNSLEPWVPVFLFCVLFALSMDYHVFLLSRIREAHQEWQDTRAAVVVGIASTARLITGAALIIVVVFAGFSTAQIPGFQQMGFGVAVALLLDATLVRSVIVPASMALLGKWNWYLPRWLEWLPRLEPESSRVVELPTQREAPHTTGVSV